MAQYPKEKDPRPIILVSGSLKAMTLGQLNYARVSRSTEVERGRQQHQTAKAKCTWPKYLLRAILVNSLWVLQPAAAKAPVTWESLPDQRPIYL